MLTSYKDDYGRTYYIDPNTGKKISKKEAYVQAGTRTDPTTGRQVDIGDTGKRTGTGYFGTMQGEGVQGSGSAYQRALVREEMGIAPTAEIERKDLKDTRIKYAKARRADRRLERIRQRDEKRKREGKYTDFFGRTSGQSKREQKLKAKSEAINTGAGGERTAEDRAKAQYFEDLRRDREETAAKKTMEVLTIAATAGLAATAGGGAGATGAAAGSGGSATAGTSSAAMVTGGAAPSSTMATIGAGTVPTGATTTVGGTAMTMTASGAVPTASLTTTAATAGGAGAIGSSLGSSGSSSVASTGTSATSSTGLTTGQKLTKALQTGKEYYDKAKPYIDAAKNISGALSAGEGGSPTPVAGQPQQQGGQLDPALFAAAQGQAAPTPTPQAGLSTAPQVQQTEMSMVPSMSGLSGGMQPQGNLKQEDNYNLSNFVNPTTMQNIYAEKGGRVKEETNYEKNLLEKGGRNKRA